MDPGGKGAPLPEGRRRNVCSRSPAMCFYIHSFETATAVSYKAGGGGASGMLSFPKPVSRSRMVRHVQENIVGEKRRKKSLTFAPPVVLYWSSRETAANHARVVELADSLDSGSSVHSGRAGSSPASRTNSSDSSEFEEFSIFKGMCGLENSNISSSNSEYPKQMIYLCRFRAIIPKDNK